MQRNNVFIRYEVAFTKTLIMEANCSFMEKASVYFWLTKTLFSEHWLARM